MSKTGVIIANTGSPASPTPTAVSEYLRQFLTDPRICPMNPTIWKIILERFILPRRSTASANRYALIWEDEGSPLEVRMSALERRLDASMGDDALVRHAASYGSPSLQDAFEELRTEGCSRIVVIPLYPQAAFSTTKVVEDQLGRVLAHQDWFEDVRFVENYSERELYLEALVESVRDAGFTTDDRLLLAFHSIPMKDVHDGDAYADKANATAREVARRLELPDEQWAIGFQSRFDSRKWVSPFTNEALQKLKGRPGRLFVLAPNFAIDCLETLYDIDIKLRQEYEQDDTQHEGGEFVYVPCLNDSEAHIRLLQEIVKDALS